MKYQVKQVLVQLIDIAYYEALTPLLSEWDSPEDNEDFNSL